MRGIAIISVLVLSAIFVDAQRDIYKVEYLCNSKGLSASRGYSGLNTLYFTDTTSLYIHNEWPNKAIYGDEQGGVFYYFPADDDGMSVYINLVQNQIVWKEFYKKVPKYNYILYDTIPQIVWQITEETMTIDGIETIKAEGWFGGRLYSAWFAPSIPVPYGPYKLNGLPGLILAAISKDGKISWRLKSFETNTSDISEISPPKNGMLMNTEEFEQFQYDHTKMLEAKYGTLSLDPPIEGELEKGKYMFYTKFKQKGYKPPYERKKLRER